MTCVICLEDRGGVMFNHRRVSRDAVVTDRILKLAAEHGPLNITPYTLHLLPQENIPPCVVHICDHPATEGKGTCWLEDTVGELRLTPQTGSFSSAGTGHIQQTRSLTRRRSSPWETGNW